MILSCTFREVYAHLEVIQYYGTHCYYSSLILSILWLPLQDFFKLEWGLWHMESWRLTWHDIRSNSKFFLIY